MKPKRLVIVQNIISNNIVNYLNRYTKEFESRGYQVTVLFAATTESNRRWQLQEKPRFKYEFLKSFKLELKGRDLFTYFINPSIIQNLNQINPDTVLIAGWDIFAYQAAFFWAKFHRRKIILRSGSTKFESSWRRSLASPLVKYMVSHSDQYIVYGTRARDYLISLGAQKNKIRIDYNDVNANYFRSQAKKFRPQKQKLKRKFNITTTKNLIYVGQLIHRKGVDLLLDSYQSLKTKNPQLGLIIIGYGKLKDQLQEQIKTNHLEDVYFFDFVDQYDLPRYYALADLLVLPSREEVWGLVANEALYSGLKVIVSDACGCAPDIIKPNSKGFIFKTNQVKSLTSKIRQALSLK